MGLVLEVGDGLAVDAGRRRLDHLRDAELGRGLEHVERADGVGREVEHRVADRPGDLELGGLVRDAVVPAGGVAQRVVVEDVAPDDGDVAVDAFEVLVGAGRVVVEHGHRRAGRHQIPHEMRSDETRAAGHQDPRPPKIHGAQDRGRTSRPCRTSSPFPAPNARLRSSVRGRDRTIGGPGPRRGCGRIRDAGGRARPPLVPSSPYAIRAGLIAGALTLVLRLVGVVVGPDRGRRRARRDRVPSRPRLLGRPVSRGRRRGAGLAARFWAGCPKLGSTRRRRGDTPRGRGRRGGRATRSACAGRPGRRAAGSRPRSCWPCSWASARGALVGDPVHAAFGRGAAAPAAAGLGQPDPPQLPQLEPQARELRDRAAERAVGA